MMQTNPDWDSLVRTVQVRYSIPGRAGWIIKDLEVGVQRLVLLYMQAEMDMDQPDRTSAKGVKTLTCICDAEKLHQTFSLFLTADNDSLRVCLQ